MAAQATPANDDPNSVRKTTLVQAPPAVAWRVFTEQMAAWWPLAVYKSGKANAVDAVLEPGIRSPDRRPARRRGAARPHLRSTG